MANENPLVTLRGEVERMRPEFLRALPKHVDVDRFIRVTQTAINMAPDLALCDRVSLFGALTKCAADGLIPDGREAAIVVFNSKTGQKAVYMPMVGGILKKIRNSGELLSVTAHVVHANDEFKYELGDSEHIMHRPKLGDDDRGKEVAVYAILKTKDGGIYRDVMTTKEVEKVRASSRAAQSGPWVNWWGEMAKKTVLKRLSKRVPMSTDLDNMLQADAEIDGDSSADISATVKPQPAPQKQALQEPPVNAVPKASEPKTEVLKPTKTDRVAEKLRSANPPAPAAPQDQAPPADSSEVGNFDDLSAPFQSPNGQVDESQPIVETQPAPTATATAPVEKKRKVVGHVRDSSSGELKPRYAEGDQPPAATTPPADTAKTAPAATKAPAAKPPEREIFSETNVAFITPVKVKVGTKEIDGRQVDQFKYKCPSTTNDLYYTFESAIVTYVIKASKENIRLDLEYYIDAKEQRILNGMPRPTPKSTEAAPAAGEEVLEESE